MSLRDNTERHFFRLIYTSIADTLTIWLNENAYQSTDRYFGESVLPRCFQMVGKSIAQRLAKIFSTFGNGIVQRLAMVLSNV